MVTRAAFHLKNVVMEIETPPPIPNKAEMQTEICDATYQNQALLAKMGF